MTFTITYRDATGAMREEAVEAASRADALSALKARGISPISLRVAKPGGPQSLAAADATGFARAAGVGLPERSEPEGPQGAARGRGRRGR